MRRLGGFDNAGSSWFLAVCVYIWEIHIWHAFLFSRGLISWSCSSSSWSLLAGLFALSHRSSASEFLLFLPLLLPLPFSCSEMTSESPKIVRVGSRKSQVTPLHLLSVQFHPQRSDRRFIVPNFPVSEKKCFIWNGVVATIQMDWLLDPNGSNGFVSINSFSFISSSF